MSGRSSKEFEVVFVARGVASGKMRTDVELEWLQPGGKSEVYHLATDEGPLLGGENTAPPALAHFATALVGCLVTHIRAFSSTMRIPIRDVSVHSTFRWRGRRIGDAPYEAGLDAISIDIDVDSDAAEGDLLRLIAAAKQGCFIEQSLAQGITVAHRLKREGGWTSL